MEDTRIDEATGDLRIAFEGGTRVDIFNNSVGYEGWQFTNESGLQLIALGGGEIAIWDTSPRAPK